MRPPPPDMQLIAHLLSHFSPHVVKRRGNSKDPLLGEFGRPGEIRNFFADLSPPRAFLKPHQVMANYVSRGLSRGKCRKPSYTPYIAADMSDAPWPGSAADHTADHTAALAKWKANKKATKPGARPMPFRAWILYRMRFMITDDLCADWAPPLSGPADQLEISRLFPIYPLRNSLAMRSL